MQKKGSVVSVVRKPLIESNPFISERTKIEVLRVKVTRPRYTASYLRGVEKLRSRGVAFPRGRQSGDLLFLQIGQQQR